MNKIIIAAPAKINLTLDVKGKRADGYHELETIMHHVSLVDKITLTKGDNIIIESNSNLIPWDDRNLAYQAAQLYFKETRQEAGVKIFIEKNIPISAGLAGGSSNAAAVLIGLNNLYQGNLGPDKLWELACKLGSDVPFCLTNTTAMARGRGELLTPLPPLDKLHFLLVKPDFSISTREVFEKFDLKRVKRFPNNRVFLLAWQEYNIIKLANEMVNVLESVSLSLYPELDLIKSKLISSGALNAIMSGSGPTVFGLFTDLGKRDQAYYLCREIYSEVFKVSSYVRSE